jgi:hypothetical protein
MKTVIKILLTLLFLSIVLLVFVQLSQSRRNEFMAYWYFRANLRRINIAITEYANEHSGKMPEAQVWADMITKQNKLILREDFRAPHSSFRVCYNANLGEKLYSDLKEGTIVLFMGRGDLNANGDKNWFYENSVNRKHSYLITLNGEIYRHNPDRDDFLRLSDGKTIPSGDLLWK